MEFTNFDNEQSSQNTMATILKSLPKESGLTKIEYEGPSIALYSKNPRFLIENSQILSNMVNIIRKRVVIRSDESIRKSRNDSTRIIQNRLLPLKVKTTGIFFDDALGELTIYISNSFEMKNQIENAILLDLVSETGWKIKLRKSTVKLPTIQFIDKVLDNSTNYRIKFYKEVGDKVFRPKLSPSNFEASIVTLGGFGEIGRSCLLVVTKESKILLDCGINTLDEKAVNYFPRFDMTGFTLDEIDAVIITHAHIDHIGFLPFLYKYGYRGPVYCTEPTLPLMILLFLDYHKNHEIYSEEDITNVIIHTMPLSIGVVTDISPDVKLVLYNSGHILGSTSIHLHIGNGNHNLVYTGDLKFGKTNLLENASWNFPRVETLIIEGTFGSKDLPHKREETDPILVESINQTLREGGRVLIPVPIIGLSQELIYTLTKYQELGSLEPSAEIFVDKSILEATYIHELYSDYLSKEIKTKILNENVSIFNYKNLKVHTSKSKLDKPGIILVPSSMLNGGLSVKFLKQIHNDPLSKLILISNQVTGTLGKEIQTGHTEVTINGQQKLKLKCKIESIHGFSNHSDYNQLLAYISRLKPKLKRVIINHGEKPRVQNLASSVNKILNIQCQYLLVPEAIKLL
ncbi:MAG TPA: beta-CASP ribonuclease aCPSF1 [Nitrososphaeraceae archaeon]|nr:beta-CASP ribonuclease aCPSF1 [Nitrososphaeraceae archaeon]